MRTRTWTGALAALLLAAGAALAAAPKYPASVAGTWNVSANGFTGTMQLQQAGGKNLCRAVTGTFFGAEPVSGFYCPSTGRLVFSRNGNGVTQQVFQAQLGRVAQGKPILAGSFAAVRSQGGAPGEYAFYGVPK